MREVLISVGCAVVGMLKFVGALLLVLVALATFFAPATALATALPLAVIGCAVIGAFVTWGFSDYHHDRLERKHRKAFDNHATPALKFITIYLAISWFICLVISH